MAMIMCAAVTPAPSRPLSAATMGSLLAAQETA